MSDVGDAVQDHLRVPHLRRHRRREQEVSDHEPIWFWRCSICLLLTIIASIMLRMSCAQ